MGFIGVVAWLFSHLVGLKERTSQLAGYLIGFWPMFVFHSAIIRRDTAFAFLLFLSMYLFASFLDKRTKNSVVKILLFLFSVISVCLLRYGFWAIYIFLFGILLFIKSFDLLKFRISYSATNSSYYRIKTSMTIYIIPKLTIT